MKNYVLSVSFLLISFLSYSQDSDYESIMVEKVAEFIVCENPDQLYSYSNDFVRIGKLKETDWLPFYYASMALVKQVRLTEQADKKDSLLDIVDFYSNKIDSIVKDTNGEVEVGILKYLSLNSRMLVNPEQRYMKQGIIASNILEELEEKAPDNPRVLLLRASVLIFSPKSFGGDSNKAKEVLNRAKELLLLESNSESFDRIFPHWGIFEVNLLLGMLENN